MSEKLALGIYRHYKGKEYQVIAVARHSVQIGRAHV